MKVLLIDDDQDCRICVGEFLRDLGHQVSEAGNGQEALSLYQQDDFPMVLSDIKMPKMSGLELLQAIASLPAGPDTDVVLFTGHGDMETAIEALRAGAYDYLLKPINVEELAILTERIAEHQSLRRENKHLTESFSHQLEAATAETNRELARLKKMVVQSIGLPVVGIFSEPMQDIMLQARKYHQERSIPVLIEGETGTGKEVIAKTIHYEDLEDTAPFVDVNCAALTPNLFESELFGYEGGAFTGGLTKGQKGKFDLAQGGTLFLDEVAEIPLAIQGKLLRVLQEKEFYRVGGLKKIKIDVRVICATNMELEKKVAEGSFRKDLYFRLKVGHLIIPPLRNRRDEIIPLAEMFLHDFSRQKGRRFKGIGEEAKRILSAYAWPGNVRELRNVMEWVVFMHDDDQLKPLHLGIMDGNFAGGRGRASNNDPGPILNPSHFTLPPTGFSLQDFINQVISQALKLHHGNKTETARYLGLSRRALYSRLENIKEFSG